VPIGKLKIGDVVLVRPDEKIPVDGRVVGGKGSVNEALITGESVPRHKAFDAHFSQGPWSTPSRSTPGPSGSALTTLHHTPIDPRQLAQRR
jgi:magnesium-transporting ATPase (P-type)